MRFLLKKEIQSFFSSLTGYLVIVVFLSVTGLCLWVLPGILNIPDNGYATLESLFFIAPWIFLFLVPAITMRSFSEEFKTGTIELLLTKPMKDIELVFAKFFASFLLIVISLLPCLVYIFSVWQLGNPPGNLDAGATWGAMTGLLFLGAIYAAIGTFTSSLTDNQIIAFIVAAALSFIFFEGFNAFAGLFSSGNLQDMISLLGIKSHYASISRGVIDSRDLFYFLAVIFIFLLLTRLKIQNIKYK